MKLVDKTLLMIFIIIIMALSILFIGFGFNLVDPYKFIKIFQLKGQNYIYSVAGILLIISCIIFIMSELNKKSDSVASIILTSNYGNISVSFNTIANLVEKKARTHDGINTQKIYVSKVNEKISISIDVTVSPDVNIPEVAEKLQKDVKNYIENTTAVYIDSVKVNVVNLSSTLKMRVE
ncbi:alkaline shock response membrane anchor protein AmaP [Thermoanaerobacterium thermosaccharolyticum]|uniref:alkaline shock response membrane anchor protein AmaP n=1 Tax=Thermoanaerobacterium thermosaccharolyticum TaxID=1517 RepID=UPI003D26EDE1